MAAQHAASRGFTLIEMIVCVVDFRSAGGSSPGRLSLEW